MKTGPGPYTPQRMDGGDARVARYDALQAEAKAALTDGAARLRTVRDRYRQASVDGLGRGADLTDHHAELGRIELAIRALDSAWLFLERGDAGRPGSDEEPTSADFQTRLVEAQEAERARLAQEVHDGPAQALSNAIFQVEYIERVLDQDARLARTELRFLRELLRRELGEVRSFISQLRPPILVELGLDGSIVDTATTMAALSNIRITTELTAPPDRLAEAEQTVVLRIVQEALQNVRKHAAASAVVVSTKLEDDAWALEVRDDGRGFDPEAVAGHGRRSFGLQFMRERAELIGARFDVRSRPDGGTVVRLAITLPHKENQ
jgi:signal transduction histidine kinase